MKLQKIYRQLWMEVHPRPQSADTDQWYVDFANRLLPLFEKSELTGQMIHKNRAVLYFTWYLEDCAQAVVRAFSALLYPDRGVCR